jgi:hypothetical protein
MVNISRTIEEIITDLQNNTHGSLKLKRDFEKYKDKRE